MAQRIPENELQAIEETARRHAEGVTAQEIARTLKAAVPLRTLQYRLKYLVDHNRLVKEGEGRWARYRHPSAQAPAGPPAGEARTEEQTELAVPLSKSAVDIQNYVRQPLTARKPAGYNREFLDSYRPNVSAYLSPQERAHLRQVGTPAMGDQPAYQLAASVLAPAARDTR